MEQFESESNAGEEAERNRGRKTRELVNYREAASQRDWWEKRVRIKLHINPKLREGDAKNDIRMASSRTARRETVHMVSNKSRDKIVGRTYIKTLGSRPYV